ncbi:type III secretion system cytoplasmic ring protein SctQ [Pseudomonas quasicaspiana]|uniref:type III secretion system cytoplasmic ring protein SctQ n=1 Tax=Pseudomonas quasicaspiana TaxID=2829821 RepID=UPI001E4B8C78|nr:type III secretion system cytoplasmic ring protein SctQ [Pseudomonas quasicaspiana]MCD5974977.1 type III secretion system cytoplasmic ring protein SctQ [Pseudomonas quasicaspiana]
MNAQALPLRQVSHVQARLSRKLAGEPWMAFNVEGQTGRLTLKASRRAPVAPELQCFDSTLGTIGLSDAQPVLNAWSSCPGFAGFSSTDSDEDWLWPLYNAGLSSELAAVLGTLKPLPVSETARADWVYCDMSLQLSQGRVDSVLAVSAPALADWLDAPAWNANPPRDHSGLTLAFALRLGSLNLPRQTLETLRPGDVLCPTEADFDTAGFGVLTLGQRRLQVRVCEQPERLQLEVLEIEETTVADRNELDEPIAEYTDPWADEDGYADEAEGENAFADEADAPDEDQYYTEPAGHVDGEDGYADQADQLPQSPATPTEAFADLAMPLTLRCGQIRLPLGELAALAPGAILEVPGVTPGLAGLYYGERRLAQGELVDVEGRLGLQITQLDERG